MENTQIEVVKKQVGKALEVVQELSVITVEEYSRAVEVGTRIKEVSKEITKRKEEITKPMNEALKSARALFKPLEETLEQAESELKTKMLSYMQKKREEEAEAQRKADEEIAKQKELLKNNEISHSEASQATVKAIMEANVAKVEIGRASCRERV